MKRLKQFDLAGQILMLALGTILTFVNETNEGLNFLIIYFLAGGWQLLSFIIHMFIMDRNWYSGKLRILYGKTILCTVLVGIASLIISVITDSAAVLLYLFSLLFISPMYAICYFCIGVKEIRMIKQKELIHLK